MTTTTTLQVAIGTYDHTKALKDGSVSAPGVQFDFVEVSPITRAFRNMVADLAYDVSEMALCTYMLAKAYDRPVVGLPIVLVRAPLLNGLVTAANGGVSDPKELNGKTLGVRSYTQTSGVWVRGMLQDLYGVDLKSLKWVTFEGAHLDQFTDPPNVSRAPAGKQLPEMVSSGEVAAGIGVPASDAVRPLLSDPRAAEAAFTEKTGVRPINHIVVVKKDVLDRMPNFAAELTSLFAQAKAAGGGSGPDSGIAANRPAFEALSRYAYEQGVTP